MKKVFLILLLLPQILFAQDVTIDSQEQIDNWTESFISGGLTISGTNITDVSGLSELQQVNGYLEISGTSLENLGGLENLAGFINFITIISNPSLTDISAAENLSTENFTCLYNPLLVDAGELNGTTSMVSVWLEDCPLLDLNSAFSSTTHISVFNVKGDVNINGFNSISEIDQFRSRCEGEITGFNQLTHISSLDYDIGFINFPALQTIDEFNIAPPAQLQNFIGLPSVESIGSWHFVGLCLIETLGGCPSVNYETFQYNSDCSGLVSLQYIGDFWSEFLNGLTFDGLEGVTEIGSMDINAFPGYNNNVDFQAFSGVETITTQLRLTAFDYDPNLAGFESLSYVEYLNATFNPGIDNACAFPDDVEVVSHTLENNGDSPTSPSNQISNWLSPCNDETGCTDPTACNYDPAAQIEDNSLCLWLGAPCDDGDELSVEDSVNENCECAGTIFGCMYDVAINYNPNATEDDESCLFPSCLEGDLDGNLIVGVEDLLILLTNFGSTLD